MSKDDHPEEEKDFPTTPLKPIKTLPSPPPSPRKINSEVKDQVVEEEEEECRTPTSEEHKIPQLRSCPPAPRKSRANPTVSCKRTRRRLLSERLEFLPAFNVSDEELDGFFRSFYEVASPAKRKRS